MRDNRYNKGIQTCQLKKTGNITWQKNKERPKNKQQYTKHQENPQLKSSV